MARSKPKPLTERNEGETMRSISFCLEKRLMDSLDYAIDRLNDGSDQKWTRSDLIREALETYLRDRY